jgi:hypothetical protein
VGALVFTLAMTLFAPGLTAGPAIDPDADRIFRASCKYLADAKCFCVKVEAWKDIVIPSGMKIQTTKTLDGDRLPIAQAPEACLILPH